MANELRLSVNARESRLCPATPGDALLLFRASQTKLKLNRPRVLGLRDGAVAGRAPCCLDGEEVRALHHTDLFTAVGKQVDHHRRFAGRLGRPGEELEARPMPAKTLHPNPARPGSTNRVPQCGLLPERDDDLPPWNCSPKNPQSVPLHKFKDAFTKQAAVAASFAAAAPTPPSIEAVQPPLPRP